MTFSKLSLILLIIFPLNLWSKENCDAIGKISTIKPKKNYHLKIIRDGKAIPRPTSKTKLCVGDKVLTLKNTQAIIRFDDGNTLLLRKNSKVTIKEYKSKTIGTIKTEGIIHGFIDNKYEGSLKSHFEFTSETAVAGVRGSIIGIYVAPDQTLTAFLQQGVKPAYMRASTGETQEVPPNQVASTGGEKLKGEIQIVPFDQENKTHKNLKVSDNTASALSEISKSDKTMIFDKQTLGEVIGEATKPAAEDSLLNKVRKVREKRFEGALDVSSYLKRFDPTKAIQDQIKDALETAEETREESVGSQLDTRPSRIRVRINF